MRKDYKLISLSEVVERTSLSKTTIYRMMRVGLFPQSIQIAANRVGWSEVEVEAWLRGLIEQRKQFKGSLPELEVQS